MSLDRMHRETGIDRRRIKDLLRQQNTPLRTRTPLPPEQLPSIITQYRQGATLRTLEQRTGCSYSTIRRTLLDAGITLRPPRARTAASGTTA